MRSFPKIIAAAAFAVTGLAGASMPSATAAPMPVLGSGYMTPDSGLTEVRYTPRRKSVRRFARGHRRGVPHAAIIGAFGAIVAGAIARSQYEDRYYAPAYGYSAYPAYGYGTPAYSYSGPVYGGGWRGGHGGHHHGGRVGHHGGFGRFR